MADWKFKIDGPEFSRTFTNERGEEFKLSLHVVIDSWPPKSLTLQLRRLPEIDDWVSYERAELKSE